MKITFLGTGHGRAEPHRFHASAVLTVGNSHYMIDAGAPISTLCLRYGFLHSDIKGIFITHSHIDHCIGLPDFVNQVRTKHPDVNIPVYVPDRIFCDPMMEFLQAVKKRRSAAASGSPAKVKGEVSFTVYSDGEIFDDGKVKVTAVPVEHYMNAHAFIIEAEGKRVCFTGDLRRDLSDYPKQIFSEDFDLVVCEAAHNTLNSPDTVEILSRSRTKKFYVTHINEEKNPVDTVVKEFAEAVSHRFPVTVANDGDTVEL